MSKLRWGKEEVKPFNQKILKCEQVSGLKNLADDFFWWVLFAVSLGATVWILYRLYCLYQIHLFIKNL